MLMRMHANISVRSDRNWGKGRHAICSIASYTVAFSKKLKTKRNEGDRITLWASYAACHSGRKSRESKKVTTADKSSFIQPANCDTIDHRQTETDHLLVRQKISIQHKLFKM